jgi:NADH dehydrogenase
LGASLGAELDRAGRVLVNPDLSLPGHPEIFVIGDMASLTVGGKPPLPGVAQVAMQGGEAASENILRRSVGKPTRPFRYRDLGNMATIGRNSAVADFGWMRVKGYVAWLMWLFLHIFELIGFRNRLTVMIQWAFAYLSYQRSVRLITDEGRHRERAPR